MLRKTSKRMERLFCNTHNRAVLGRMMINRAEMQTGIKTPDKKMCMPLLSSLMVGSMTLFPIKDALHLLT
jgi:hypothetical protein